jgi:hypothetical protein
MKIRNWIHIGLFSILSVTAVVGCSSKQATMGDNMGVSDSSMAASEATPPVTVAANSGSSANLGAASSGSSR